MEKSMVTSAAWQLWPVGFKPKAVYPRLWRWVYLYQPVGLSIEPSDRKKLWIMFYEISEERSVKPASKNSYWVSHRSPVNNLGLNLCSALYSAPNFQHIDAEPDTRIQADSIT
jgi:hypothetical protein